MPESPAKPSPSKIPTTTKLPTASDVREAKRRRLSIATNTLSKPFRSPLLTSTPRSAATTPSPTKSLASSSGSPTSPVANIPAASVRRRPSRPLTRQTSSVPHDPELAELYKRQSSLEAKLREKKASLDTAKQALNIETAADGHGEEKLHALVEKWKTAARGAADVLYEITRQRVANSGPGGWKELIRKRGWDDDDKQPPQEQEGYEGDDEFTMGIMLKTLGIDLKLIGYDQDGDCWK